MNQTNHIPQGGIAVKMEPIDWKRTKTWVMIAILVILVVIITTTLVCRLDGDSMMPLRTGDRVVASRLLSPRTGDMVVINHPDNGRMVKLVIAHQKGEVYRNDILHENEVAVEGTQFNSDDPGIIPASWVKGVVVAVIFSRKHPPSTADVADGPKPSTQSLAVATPQNPREIEINGNTVMVLREDANTSTVAALGATGDVTPWYKPGLWVYDKGTGKCLKILNTVVKSEEGGQITMIEVDADFSSPVVGQPMYLLGKPIPNGYPLDASTLKPIIP
jgi:hypothetical protein